MARMWCISTLWALPQTVHIKLSNLASDRSDANSAFILVLNTLDLKSHKFSW
uniref:Uncharacterized protein n=1 Tax=Phlebia radiata TaxID=5308 RepID=L8B995_PHLRA|nr:hypothetical protein PRA_mt0166 [Phlebia radiata]CCE89233.1 hypothetical protein PRA_mt0166 [Phlebia radiata]